MPDIQPQVDFNFNPQFNFGCLLPVDALPHPSWMRQLLGRRINQRLIALGGRKAGRTQSWIAEKLGLTNEAISKWVLGKTEPGLANLRALAKLLECSVGYLGGDEPDDDIAAISEMAARMPKEVRRMYRKSGAGLIEPDSDGGTGKKIG